MGTPPRNPQPARPRARPAFVPDERSLHFAMGLARGHSLLSSRAPPWAEWLAAAAINLLTGESRHPNWPMTRKDLIPSFSTEGATADRSRRQRPRPAFSHQQRLPRPDQAAAYVMSSQSVSDRGAKGLRDSSAATAVKSSTSQGNLMNPVDRTEEDLEHLAQKRPVEESHGLGSQEGAGINAANKDLAKDIAAFSSTAGRS